jgi:hypothetical protein
MTYMTHFDRLKKTNPRKSRGRDYLKTILNN